jgi:hypothetical protein
MEMYKDELPIERIAKIAKLSVEQVEQIISGLTWPKKTVQKNLLTLCDYGKERNKT